MDEYVLGRDNLLNCNCRIGQRRASGDAVAAAAVLVRSELG